MKMVMQFAVFMILVSGVVTNAHSVPDNLPKVRPLLKPLDLSRPPTTEEIMAAGQLGGQLYPTHELEDKEREKEINLSFGTAIQEWNKHEYITAVKMFKEHADKYPDSPWAAEAMLHVGCDANYKGRYTEAEKSFETIIDNNKDNDYEGAKALVNKATLRMGVLKVNQNNFDEAKKRFAELMKKSQDWRDQTYASHWIQRLSQYSSKQLAVLNCGTKALAALLEKEGRGAEARRVSEMLPETSKGHSMKDLAQIASRFGYDMAGLRLSSTDLKDLPLPAIMHINGKNEGDGGHYWILEKIRGEDLALFDPQAGRWFEQTIDEFAGEWSGNAVVFSRGKELPGARLAETDMEQAYGGCCGIPTYPTDLGPPRDDEDKENSCGAPAWSVNMVSMNLFMTDTPLWYKAQIGPPVRITLSYNSQSSVVQNEPFGNKWVFNYGSYLVVDTGGQVTVVMPDGRGDVYSPDGSGGYIKPYHVFNTLTKIAENHFELRFPDDTVYVYDIPAGTSSLQPFLVEIRDAHGQALTFGYDVSVRLTTITDAMGRANALTYNASGLVTQATDPFGRSALFEYDSDRNLIKITDMGGYWTSLSYDSRVYLTGMENPRGRWVFYIEPSDGVENEVPYPLPGSPMDENYRITVTNPVGGKEEFYYSGYGAYGWRVAPKNYIYNYNPATDYYYPPQTIYYYTLVSGRGEIEEIDYPSGRYLYYYYDSNGNRTLAADYYGDTSFTYNSSGSVTSVTDPKGTVTNLTYAPNGFDLTRVQDGLGAVSMSYNSAHDVTSVTDRLNNTTNLTYNSYGQLASVTDPLNITANYSYDAGNNLQQISMDGKTLGSFTYDAVGRVRTATDAAGLALTYDYNNLDKVTKVTYPDGRFEGFAYSDCCPHLLESKTDRSGQAVYYEYDPLKRLVSATIAEGGTTRYGYDANGEMVSLSDPNRNTTAFEYDNDRRLIKKTYADGKSVLYEYEYGGLLGRRINGRGIVTTYTYDENRNLLSVTYSDGTPGVTYLYDNYNRVTRRTDGTGIYNYSYDANSRLTSIDGPWADDTITYQYDSLGRLTVMAPQGGQAITYTVDSQGRTTGVNIGTNSYSYAYINANPIPQGLTRPNGSITGYQYDTLNRLTGLSNRDSSSATISGYDYLYNSQDLRSSETITNGNPITSFTSEKTLYDYNAVNQILSTTNPNQGFAYDADGNMTRGYTPEGYIFTTTYDAENRLKSLTYTDGSNVVHKTEYYYSGDSFLAEVKKYEDANLVSDTRYVRSGPMVVQERDGGNSVTAEYTWGANMGGGIGGLLNLRKGGEDYSYLYDGKGNVTAIIDSTQAVVTTYTYDTFGNLMSSTGTMNQPYRFSTKEYDEKTGLAYYGYRFYSPATGRWINRDPLGEEGGMNLYGFVGNNPVNLLDPLGLDSTNWLNTEGARPTMYGPTNGNWGGMCWSGGQYSCGSRGTGTAPPADSGDACYQRHDNCYETCGANTQCIAACDQQLINELRELDDDPRRWTEPPRPGTEGDSRRYGDWAIWYFR